MERYIKISLVVFVALQGLVGGLGNVANLGGTYEAVAATLSMSGVPESIPRIFATNSPIMVWLGVAWIAVLKLATGATGAVGVWQLWRHRKSPQAGFQAAKRWGLAACGISILMLFGGFIVIGTTMLLMWQTPMGQVAFEGATYLLVAVGIVALYVQIPDSQGAIDQDIHR